MGLIDRIYNRENFTFSQYLSTSNFLRVWLYSDKEVQFQALFCKSKLNKNFSLRNVFADFELKSKLLFYHYNSKKAIRSTAFEVSPFFEKHTVYNHASISFH